MVQSPCTFAVQLSSHSRRGATRKDCGFSPTGVGTDLVVKEGMAMVATRSHLIGELCVGGDWACAHGDFAALRDVAHRLSSFTREPVHCALVELADACLGDPARASELWCQVKETVLHVTESPTASA
jgi:hypothetical protein